MYIADVIYLEISFVSIPSLKPRLNPPTPNLQWHGFIAAAVWGVEQGDTSLNHVTYPHDPLYSNFPWFNCIAKSVKRQK